ncbi:MAG: UvrD-helicase domain-containing protein [Acidimicrobiales bacterium]
MRALGGALTPTVEQQAAIDGFATGGTVVIEAGAGTGKTSTLRLLAAERPQAKGLYVAYNKAIQVEAERSFGRNVEARTAHSLPYRNFGAPMRNQLNGPRVTSRNAATILRPPSVPLGGDVVVAPGAVASMALRTVASFCHSADEAITAKHFARPGAPEATDLTGLSATVVGVARRAWADLTSTSGRLKPSHDVYLKLWQLSRPSLRYDFVVFDEAQDADPAVADVIVHQDAQLVAVGDSSQAIYGWRGATDFLEPSRADYRVALTRSWRFGPAVAEEANIWLGVLDARLRLQGSPHRVSTLGTVEVPDAVLCRTNTGCVAEVMAAQDYGRPVALVGGGEDMVALAEASKRLRAAQPAGHPELAAFKDWADVQDYAENDPGGSDLAVAGKLIDAHGPEAIIAAIRGCVPEVEADLAISTAHKAKGREWGQVLVADDFREPKTDPVTGVPGPIPQAEAMLAYVTVSRAMGRLDNAGLAWVHSHPAVSRSQDAGIGYGSGVPEDAEAPPTGVDHAEESCHSETVDRVRGPSPVVIRPAEPVVPPTGARVGVRGLGSEWTVRGRGTDDSVTLASGPSGHWRSVTAERLVIPGPGRARRTSGARPVPAVAEAADSPTISRRTPSSLPIAEAPGRYRETPSTARYFLQ